MTIVIVPAREHSLPYFVGREVFRAEGVIDTSKMARMKLVRLHSHHCGLNGTSVVNVDSNHRELA